MIDLNYCLKKDELDPMREFRNRFHIPDEELIYLDGNSLGMLPNKVKELMHSVVNQEWGNDLIGGWNKGWIDLNTRLGGKIAKLIGAREDEVILCDSTSVNLFKLAYAVLAEAQNKNNFVSDELNFPSDLYVLQGLAHHFKDSFELRLAKSQDGISLPLDDLMSVVNKNTALVSLSHVCFKSSFMYDMVAVTNRVHEQGARMLWDLSHAVGAVKVDLNKAEADLAVGCTYKYLNGGPGSLAFLYVRKDLQEKLLIPIWGWFSSHSPFEFKLDYTPAKGIQRFQTATPPVLSSRAVEPGIDLLLEAGIDQIRMKSESLSDLLIRLTQDYLMPLGFHIGSPMEAKSRGSHVTICHPSAYRICQAMGHPKLDAPTIIPDFREPNNIRLGLTPLYTRYQDIFRAVKRIHQIVDTKEFLNFSETREAVT